MRSCRILPSADNGRINNTGLNPLDDPFVAAVFGRLFYSSLRWQERSPLSSWKNRLAHAAIAATRGLLKIRITQSGTAADTRQP